MQEEVRSRVVNNFQKKRLPVESMKPCTDRGRNQTPLLRKNMNTEVLFKDPYSMKIADRIQRSLENSNYRSQRISKPALEATDIFKTAFPPIEKKEEMAPEPAALVQTSARGVQGYMTKVDEKQLQNP